MRKTSTPKSPRNRTFISAMTALARETDNQSSTAWLSDYRKAQIKALETANFPHPQVEHFKYNRLDVFDNQSFNRLTSDSDTTLDLDTRAIAGLDNAARIVFVNGQLSSAHSQCGAHRITAFAETNAEQQAKILSAVQAQSISHNPFTLVNASLSDNGILIEITENSPKTLIEIVNIIDGQVNQNTLATQAVIDVASNSQATVISRSLNWTHDNDNRNLSTQRTMVNIGDNAQFTHYAMQLENAHSVHVGSCEYHLHDHATLKAFHTATGSELKKIDVTVNHLGQHAHASLNGLYVATDNQQVDYHTAINHPRPNGQSDEVFRGIVNGNATATFNGRIHIYEDAQKTRAELSNKNLVLSDNAVIHTKPELEIYADDVVCAHGATVSRMDDASLNYLRARAIPKDEAELMLSYGFFEEVLDKIEHEAIADYLRPILFKRFK